MVVIVPPDVNGKVNALYAPIKRDALTSLQPFNGAGIGYAGTAAVNDALKAVVFIDTGNLTAERVLGTLGRQGRPRGAFIVLINKLTDPMLLHPADLPVFFLIPDRENTDSVAGQTVILIFENFPVTVFRRAG